MFAVPVTAGPWLEGLARNCPPVSVRFVGLKTDQRDTHNLEKQLLAHLFTFLAK